VNTTIKACHVQWRMLTAGSTVWAPFGDHGWHPGTVTGLGKNPTERTVVGLSFETEAEDEKTNRWEVRTSRGEVVSARYLVAAVGTLSKANLPKFKGLEGFVSVMSVTEYAVDQRPVLSRPRFA
jgi:glycine/D-amino acid oxidase-like deaminating enzyme